MAKRATSPTPPAPPLGGEAGLMLVSDDQGLEYEELERITAELGTADGSYVQVWRKDDKGVLRYRGRFTPEAFSLEKVREQYPQGGDFQFRIYQGGHYKKAFSVPFDGDPAALAPAPVENGGGVGPVHSPAGGQSVGTLNDAVVGLVVGLAESLAKRPDPMDSVKQAVAMIRELMPPAPPPPPPPPPPVNPLAALGEVMKMWRTFKSDNASGESDDPFERMVDKLMPLVADALLGGQRPPVAGALPPGAAVPTPVEPAPVTPDFQFAPEAPVWLVALKDVLPLLAQMHEGGLSPEAAAVDLAQKLPEEITSPLGEFADSGSDWPERLVAMTPKAFRGAHGTWCVQMLRELEAELFEADDSPQVLH